MFFRKVLSAFILILSFCFFSSATEKILVVTEEYPPYNYTDNKVVTGFSTKIVKDVLEDAGIRYDIRSMSWDAASNAALTKPNVLIYSIARSPEREDKYKWVDTVATLVIYFYKLKDNDKVTIKTLSDAAKYKTGVVNGDFRALFLKENNFTNLLYHSADLVNIKKLFLGQIDIMPNEELSMNFSVQKEGLDVNKLEKVFLIKELSTKLYMAFSLQTTDEIVEKCKNSYNKLKKSGVIGKF